MKIQHFEDYKKLRANKYPSTGEQLDAILKMAIYLKSQGFDLPVETNTWITNCLNNKDFYKKPEKK